MDINDYKNELKPTWCKGCSYYGILSAIKQFLYNKQIKPENISIISGIGCSSRISLYFNTFAMHTLHGRAIPVAIGSRIARPDIPVIVIGGDGDLFSIGIGHFVHAAQKNVNMTVICMNNQTYAMTKNQASPTSAKGYAGTLTPYGKIDLPLDPVEFAVSCKATFVSRTFFGNH
ncbi:MAG: thiamine pyrophosphate-dependent enzyme, partial [Fibrobacter sp.]|nr:thiamine pyrophosphate-dependent enzyme [Fibrobacter sp.]